MSKIVFSSSSSVVAASRPTGPDANVAGRPTTTTAAAEPVIRGSPSPDCPAGPSAPGRSPAAEADTPTAAGDVAEACSRGVPTNAAAAGATRRRSRCPAAAAAAQDCGHGR